MWLEPTKDQLDAIPRLYETEHIPLADKLIYLHFYLFDSEWFAIEYDGEDLFFGYAILNGDLCNAEWGYFSYSELKSLRFSLFPVEFDQYWEVKPAFEVDMIQLR